MKKFFITIAMGLMSIGAMAQSPSFKVDFCEPSKTDEIGLEPGYTVWRFRKDVYRDTLMVNDIKCVIYTNDEQLMRTGWNKNFVQNTENKAKNGRLTGDGVAFDPDLCGTIILRLEGLPVGTHNIQTYFSSWQDPSTTYGYPMNVKVGGKIVHENVMRTFQEPVAGNATLISTDVTVVNAGDAVEIEFITSEDNPGTPDATHTKANKTPIISAFELNTSSILEQAKAPNPNSGDMHVDCDSKSYTLSWSAANSNIAKHNLYIGLDSTSVADMTEPTAVLTDTCYTLNDIYSMNTYYWRVDEVDASNKVTKGLIWYFQPRHLAFRGAEGYGRFARGGRGGYVYHVTNLDGGVTVPGSFGYGLRLPGAHTMVFDVSGIIDMNYKSVFSLKEITVAPETAPGKGICIKHSSLNFNNDCIVRHLRAKRGYGGSENTGNALGVTGADHTILDHITAAWGTDETFSSRGALNITFQYNIIAEALGIADHKNYDTGKNHGFAATIGGDVGSFSHNFLVDCNGRNWSMGGGLDGDGYYAGRLDIFNNVCYNWCGRTTDGGAHEVNFVGNYYKEGPAVSTHCPFTLQLEGTGKGTQSAYLKNNIRDNLNGTLDRDAANMKAVQISSSQTVDWNYWGTEPYFPSYATIDDPVLAYKKVLSDVGATMPCRDNQHQRVIREARDRTYTYTGSRSKIKGEIDNETDITKEANSGWEEWPEESRAADFDTDQDGMPNWYEKIIGSDENTANHNDDPDHDGYTLLEDYLEFMSHPYLVLNPSQTGTYNVAQCFRGFTKSPVYSIEYDGSKLITPSLKDSIVTVQTFASKGISIITMKVKDADGDSFEQKLSVAVTEDATGIESINEADANANAIAKREFFTIDGKSISASQMQPCGTYILKTTDTNGKVKAVKILKH